MRQRSIETGFPFSITRVEVFLKQPENIIYPASTEITDQHASFSPFRTNAVISETINLLGRTFPRVMGDGWRVTGGGSGLKK